MGKRRIRGALFDLRFFFFAHLGSAAEFCCGPMSGLKKGRSVVVEKVRCQEKGRGEANGAASVSEG